MRVRPGTVQRAIRRGIGQTDKATRAHFCRKKLRQCDAVDTIAGSDGGGKCAKIDTLESAEQGDDELVKELLLNTQTLLFLMQNIQKFDEAYGSTQDENTCRVCYPSLILNVRFLNFRAQILGFGSAGPFRCCRWAAETDRTG